MASLQPISRGVGFKDITGQEFGRLRALKVAGKNHLRQVLWECLCDTKLGGCGKTTLATGNHLRTGHTQSCGCLQAQRRGKGSVKHGMSGTPEFITWHSMKRRCNETDNAAFERYGARGIKVCQRWMDSFENFIADMGLKPTRDHSLERVDNDGDYCPENCIWATQDVQCRNTRRTRRVTMDGRTQCLTDWALELGISIKAVRRRLDRGWPMEKALKTPLQKSKKRSDKDG